MRSQTNAIAIADSSQKFLMQQPDTLISYTNNQLLAAFYLNDELIMPAKIGERESLRVFEPSDSYDNSWQKSPKEAKFSESYSLINKDRDRHYIQNGSYCDINQKINTELIKSVSFKNKSENFNEDIAQANAYTPKSNLEKLRVYNLALKTEEIEMPSDRVSNDALVMHLKFEQTSGTQAIDSSSFGKNQGELRNGSTFKNVAPPLGGTVNFDGLNDYVSVKDSNNINLTTITTRTISLWFRVDDKNLSNRKQVLYEEGGARRGLNIYVHNGRLYVGGWNNESSQRNWQGTYLSTEAIASDRWHHVTLTLNAQKNATTSQLGTLTAYLDGKNFGTGNGSQIGSHIDNIGIGGLNQSTQFHDGDATGTGTNGLKGNIDDVRIYNRVLSDREIADLASKTATSSSTPTATSTNTSPVANSDRVTTKEDTPITILTSKLLGNDSDANGDSLKIIGVSNAVNGSVTLGNRGNIVFNPQEDFSGTASFQYTVSDNRGGTTKATVSVSVLGQAEPSATSVQLGVNLAKIADWSTQLPFLDAFKSSRGWMTQDPEKFIWNTNETTNLRLDSDQWVTYVPNRNDPAAYTAVGTLMFREIEGRYPGGKYIVLYDGEGTLEYGFDAKKDKAASRPGRDVIDVTPSDSGIWLQIRATDPKGTGNYLRDIRVIPAAYENTYQNQIFNPKFIDKIKDFEALRFMEWMETNNSRQSQWSDRPTQQNARYSQNGVPVEVMVKLANQADIDPWFTMPHAASNDYIANFARYVRDNLESGRKVYVELSNELWNVGFKQSKWVLEQAKKLWPGSNKSDYELRLDYVSKRTTEVMQIWDKEFGASKDKVIGVMAGQAANIGIAKQLLSYNWTSQPQSHKAYGIDAIAIAPYYGYYLGTPSNISQIEGWTRDADGGLKKLFDELTQGGVLQNGPSGGALQQAYGWMASHAELAKKEGLQLLAYEGGSHVTGINGAEDNAAITKLFMAAHRDARMGEIYKDYLQKWYELGGGLFMHYKDIHEPTKWGSWGLIEHVDDTSSPRYDAVMEIIQSS
ncbi:MAG: cadherin-like domain-containing protein [Hydrococcus sp. RU_2_2]|nr:cadherin-like domain-containing protein [Hydrococcus sp. RU_2_2]